MKSMFLFRLPLLVLALMLGSGNSTLAASQSPEHGVFTEKLANGLQVIAVEDHAAPVVQTGVWYRFGSLYEVLGKTGLAHALEHMMFRGTREISAGGLDDIVARLGAQMNAETSYDYTHFFFTMPADKLGVALSIEADRMQHAALRQADWQIERGAVLSEIDGDQSSPFFSLLSQVRAAAYPDSPFGRTSLGSRADVARARASDIRSYYSQWYAPNNAALVVSGDIDHQTVFALARRDFGGIPAKRLPSARSVSPKPASGKIAEAQFPFPFEVLDLAYAIPGDTEPGEPSVSTLATYLSSPRSPFYQQLVQTKIALALYANADTQLRGGLMNIFIILSPGHTGAQAQAVFQNTLDSVLKNGFDADLVAAAKRQTLAQRILSADSISGYGDLVGYTYGVVGEQVRDEDQRLAAVSAQSLLDVTRKYLSTPTVVGHLSPNAQPPKSHSEKTTASASDNFSGRIPNGPIIEPSAIRLAVSRPTKERSKLAPITFTLANGMKVIVQEKHDRPTVYVSGSIDYSPTHEPADKAGLLSLASTLANFGSANYPFAAQKKAIDDLGAQIGLGQGFSAAGLAKDLVPMLKIVADAEEHPSFDDPYFSLQRDQLAGSIAQDNSISGKIIDRAYRQLLFDPLDAALRYPTPQSVQSISRDDLLTYTQRYWRPDLTTVGVVGDVTPDQVRSALQTAFGDWKNSGPTPDDRQLPYPSAHSGHAYVGTDANQVFIQLGQPIMSRTSPDFYPMTLLTQILAGSGAFESRLWQEMRQKRGLVYNVSADISADKDRGDFKITMSAAPGNTVAAVRFVRAQLERIQREPVSQTELAHAKSRLVNGTLLAQESASGQLGLLMNLAEDGLPSNYYAGLNDRYAKITAADIERVAKTYLRPKALIEIFSGPPGVWQHQAI
ncbi:MAG: insulinase family protein [Candidatus Eremiobacteraeota bacterium]|nr:insulinase family protein [Candidatus Eremiobacteraeota bacterium]